MDLKNKKQRTKFLLLIFALTFLIYGNSIKNGYALDDNFVTVTTPERPNNPRIEKGISGIPKIFSSHYIESGQQAFEYRPLVLTSFAIEYQFFGSNPHISHFINVLLYAITNSILFLILLKIFKNYNYIFPLLITLLFIIHPIHTEVVANIKSRDELMSFLFGICSLLLVLKNIETKKTGYFILSIVFLLMGLMCKRTAILFVALIPITLYFFYSLKQKQLILICGLLVLPIICFSVLKNTMLQSSSSIRIFAFFENPLYYEDSFAERIPLALYSIGYYIKLLIFPYPLCCYYGYNTIPFSDWTTPFVIISLILYATISTYAIRKFKQKNIFSYSIIIYLLGIIPFSNILSLPTGIIAERYIYFASLGFCIASAYFLIRVFKINILDTSNPKIQKSSFFSICIMVIFIIFSSLTISRNAKWKDELTLFSNDTKNFKNSCNLHYITGNKLYTEIFNTKPGNEKESLINRAKFHFKQAAMLMEIGVKKYPKDYTTLNNIGTIYVNIFNDPVTAQPYFEKSLAINPNDMNAQFNFAFCYEKRDLKDSAIFAYEKMISRNYDYLQTYLQLRELYISKKNYKKVISCDKKAITLNPADAKLHINLGNAYMLINDTINGINEFEKAISFEPTNRDLRNKIVSFLKLAGYSEKATKLEN